MAAKAHDGISELSKAGKHRWEDAKALFGAGRWSGAMYVAGYTVECLLKTKLMKRFRCRNLAALEIILQKRGILGSASSVYTHHLELLLQIAGGHDRLRSNDKLWPRFRVVNRWVPAWRYTADLGRKHHAAAFLESGEAILQWIENNV